MKSKIFLILIILIGLGPNIFPQTLFRSGLFLHHSTGGIIWDNSSPNVPQLMNLYNTENNYTDNNAVTMNLDERFFPPSRPFSDHNWDSWHAVFFGQSPYPEDVDSLQSYIANNPVIVIKTGWGGTSIAPIGNPADTLIIDDEAVNSGGRTYYRTQWHWRSIIRLMQSYPDNFFVVWTGIPLMPGPNYDGTIAHSFVLWAKDTLAAGNDPIFGDFPDNVYVFDAFHLLATPTENFWWGTAYWGMNPLYHDVGDNHPNEAGANVVAQPFVWETFDAAIIYEESLLPVELSSFSASIIGSIVKLNWKTETEVNNYGFDIERKEGSRLSEVGTFEKIGFIQGNGNSNSPKYYSFEDNNLTAGKYSYRLKQIDTDGQFEYSKVIEVDLDAPMKYELSQNYPNPFNPVTTIQFSIPEAREVKLMIYNILGEQVAELVNESKEAGVHTINFNAAELNSGLYIYKLTAGNFNAVKKLMVIK